LLLVAATTRTDDDLAAAVSVAVAIGVFGVVYGATAAPVLGTAATVASSALVFSGAGQFSMVALLAAGAGPLAALGATVPLALRHLPLGAVLRPHLTAGRGRRAALSWFLIDETTGLALARPDRVERTLTLAGALAYGAWVLGTGAGVGGAALPAIEPLAGALFPVLFIGLAAVTAAGTDGALRAALAGTASLVLLVAWPGAGVLGAIAVAALVAVPGGAE
jgi:predicted branched-subunit amino acid permease